jgi:hypothetical protein
MNNKRPNRSDKYQYLLLETVCSHEQLETFSNEESFYKRLCPFEYNERIAELEDELKSEFWRVVEENLTERQKEVMKLVSAGKTQMEIAKQLNVNQSSITKSLNGNVDYSSNMTGKSGKKGARIYGGSLRKLIKVVETDKKIQEILQKISDLRGENWL